MFFLGSSGLVDWHGEAVHLKDQQYQLSGTVQHPSFGQQSDPVSAKIL